MHLFVEKLVAKGRIEAADVLKLRGEVFKDGVVSRDEVSQLIFLARQLGPNADREWGHYLNETVADYMVRQQQPTGFIQESDANWLIGIFGQPETAPETMIDTLCHVIKNATNVPVGLIDFGIAAIRSHVLADGRITTSEVAQLSALLYAMGGDGHINITRAEAELLFDLNDATRGEVNAQEWQPFFTKAICAYVMAHTGYTPPSREEALRVETWLNSPNAGVGGFFAKMVSGGLSALTHRENNSAEAAYAKRNAVTKAQEGAERTITHDEISWLADRIGKDGIFDETEAALLSHLKQLNGDLPQALTKLAG